MRSVTKPVLAGLAFGLFLAALRGHWDDLSRKHESNPFHRDGQSVRDVAGDGHFLAEHDSTGWETKLFSYEKKAVDATRAKESKDALFHDVDVDVSVDDDATQIDFITGNTGVAVDETSAFFADLEKPLHITYPDPFKRFTGCDPEPARAGLRPRKLDLIAKPDDRNWPKNCEGHAELCAILRKTAINREVLAAVANSGAPGIFEFIDGIVSLGIENFVIIALDDALHDKLKNRKGVASYRVKNDAQGSHKVSAQKFGIVKQFVDRGCSVLLTDTDVAYLRNPFPFLYRDSDVESMSDGWDASSAFGFFETVDDASLGRSLNSGRKHALSFRVAALNSGMWLVMATQASSRLMTTMAHRMATEQNLWDQAGYNLELWFASRDNVRVSGATVRVLHPLCFVNSKVMFRFIRHAPNLRKEKHTPIAMHSNYHTDKAFKMKRVYAYYNGDKSNGVTGIEELAKGCVVGCDSNLKTVARLEKDAKANVNDAIVGSKKWTEGSGGVWGGKQSSQKAGGTDSPQHCAPVEPLNGSGRSAKYEPHRVGRKGIFCEKLETQTESLSEDFDFLASAVCAKLNKLNPNSAELILVTVDGYCARSVTAFTSLLEHGIRRLGLSEKTLVVTNAFAVKKLARDFGVAATVVVNAAHGAETGTTQDASKGIPRTSPLRTSVTLLKWYVATFILADGYDLLVTDPTTVLLKDPSGFFFKDADVQTLSSGWDDTTSYGYDHVVDDPAMDWSRYCHGGRVVASDVAFVRFAATAESVTFASLLARRLRWFLGEENLVSGEMDSGGSGTTVGSATKPYSMANLDPADASSKKNLTEKQFEQLAFNELLYLPSQGGYVAPGVVKRTLNYLCFANSKTVFRFLRKDGKLKDRKEHTPVAVSFSFHPNEAVARGSSLRRFYVKAEQQALSGWSDGEGRGDQKGENQAKQAFGASCAGDSEQLRDAKKAEPHEEDAHQLGRHFRVHRDWSWGSVTPFAFNANGELQTPWGGGTWGFIESKETEKGEKGATFFAAAIWARFVGATHVLNFEPSEFDEPNFIFVSERCADGDMVVGRVVQ